ncbi:hypothetical protein BT93_I1008 [Corymbia citriodora subsp. variegata]|nr:hypothetical protein BT93_I1008 [Corymbia citriodora subsp. variegata]
MPDAQIKVKRSTQSKVMSQDLEKLQNYRQLGPANPGDENTKGPTTSNRQGPHGPTFRADGQARAAFPRRRRRRWRRRPRFLAQTPRRERVGERGRHPSRICHDS